MYLYLRIILAFLVKIPIFMVNTYIYGFYAERGNHCTPILEK